MKLKLPRWLRKFLRGMGVHLKYEWHFGHKECICGEARWE